MAHGPGPSRNDAEAIRGDAKCPQYTESWVTQTGKTSASSPPLSPYSAEDMLDGHWPPCRQRRLLLLSRKVWANGNFQSFKGVELGETHLLAQHLGCGSRIIPGSTPWDGGGAAVLGSLWGNVGTPHP